MEEKKKPSDREQFSLNIDIDLKDKLCKIADEKGIPLNTYIKIILNDSIQKY